MWDALFVWISQQVGGLWSSVDTLVPDMSSLGTACATVTTTVSRVSWLAWLFPGPSMGIAFALAMAGVLAGLAIMIVRITASFLTLGGGGS